MDNKTILEGILWDLKCLADLFLHGSIESGTPALHKKFKDGLNDILTLQNELYTLMSEEGMYAVTNVAETKITKTKSEFEPTLDEA